VVDGLTSVGDNWPPRSLVVEGDFNIVPFAPALSLPSRTSNGKDELHKCTHRQGSVLFLMWLHSSWFKVMTNVTVMLASTGELYGGLRCLEVLPLDVLVSLCSLLILDLTVARSQIIYIYNYLIVN
jgi:hypothetical protein